MSSASGPSIATSGLVLDVDMNNTQKSWLGAPATNLVVTVPYTADVYTACSGPVTATTYDATNQLRTVNRYTINATGGTPRARIVATGLSTGINYSYSCKIKYNGPTASPTWYIDSSKGNPEGGANNNTFNTNTSNFVSLGNGWYQLTLNFNYATCSTGGAWANFGLTAPDATYLNQTFDAYNIQFEQNTYATPYVAGTRSTSQAIVDLTNNNAVTAASLTYASDNTFSFNGTADYVYANQTGGFLNNVTNNFFADVGYAWTVSAWFKFPIAPVGTRTGNSAFVILVNGGVIGGGETLTLFVGSGTDTTYGAYAPYYCAVGIRGTKTILSTAPVNTNTWNHAVVTWDGTAARVYFNGIDRGAASTATGAAIQNGYYFSIGMNANTGVVSTGFLFEGTIGTAQVYSRALSANEVAQNFNATRSRYGL